MPASRGPLPELPLPTSILFAGFAKCQQIRANPGIRCPYDAFRAEPRPIGQGSRLCHFDRAFRGSCRRSRPACPCGAQGFVSPSRAFWHFRPANDRVLGRAGYRSQYQKKSPTVVGIHVPFGPQNATSLMGGIKPTKKIGFASRLGPPEIDPTIHAESLLMPSSIIRPTDGPEIGLPTRPTATNSCWSFVLHPALALLWEASEMAVEAFGSIEIEQAWLFAPHVSDLLTLGLTEPQIRLLEAKDIIRIRSEANGPASKSTNGQSKHIAADRNLPSAFEGQACGEQSRIGLSRAESSGPGARDLTSQALILLTPHGVHSISSMLEVARLNPAPILHQTSSTVPIASIDRCIAATHFKPHAWQANAAKSEDVVSNGATTDPRLPTPELKPHYDAARRELWYAGHLIKRYKVPAKNQELILLAFEEEGWPAHVDDPLPPAEGLDPKLRLRDTITQLNRHHETVVFRFHGDGIGSGITWSTNTF